MFETDPVVLAERKDVSLLLAQLGYKIVCCQSEKDCFKFTIFKERNKR